MKTRALFWLFILLFLPLVAEAQTCSGVQTSGSVISGHLAVFDNKCQISDGGAPISQTYPSAGVAISTGTAWGSSISVGTSGAVFGLLNSNLTFGGTDTFLSAITGNLSGNASTATALAAAPTACSGSQFATGIGANGNAICGTPSGGISVLTGDVTTGTPVGGSAVATLATVNSNTGSFGDATHTTTLTLDAKGRVTAATQLAIGTLNQNTTGTAANITATTNSTLTTLSNLSLPVSQVTGAAPLASPAFTGTVGGAASTWTGIVTGLDFIATGSGANIIPVGTTGQRPSPSEGMLRDNTTLHAVEAYLNGGWQSLSGGGSGSIAIGTTTVTGGTSPGLLYVTSGNTVGSVLLNGLCGFNAFTVAQCGAFLGYVEPEWYGAQGNGGDYYDGVLSVTSGITSIATATATSTAPAAPAITTTQANDVVVSVYDTLSTFSAQPSPGTTRANVAFTTGKYGLLASDQVMATAGTTSPVSGTLAFSTLWSTATFALAPSGTIAFVASTTTNASVSSWAVTLNKPTGTLQGHYLISCLAYFGSASYTIAPQGWAMIAAEDPSSNPLVCFGKFAGASEPSSYTFYAYGNTAGAITGAMLAYSGVAGIDNYAAPTTLTSATANYASSSVGDPICLALSTTSRQACGTISTFNSSTSVGLNLGAVTVGSSAIFGYGTDDTAAFTSMLSTAPCGTKGCKIIAGPNHYVLTSGLKIPPNLPVTLSGAGPGVLNTANTFINSNVLVNANNGTQLQYLTVTMPTAALTLGGTLHVTSTTSGAKLENFSLYGGVGYQKDGGGTGGPNGTVVSDALDVLNYQGLSVDNVFGFNFSGAGAYVDGMAASDFRDYIENIHFNRVYFSFNNGPALQVGSALAVSDLETVSINQSSMETNGGPGISLLGANIQGFSSTNNTIQWNNNKGANPEVLVSGNVIGGKFDSNYVEVTSSVLTPVWRSLSNGAVSKTIGTLGLAITPSNFFNGGFVPVRYSAAGTALPSCSQTYYSTIATVSDSTLCTNGTTYTSGGTTFCNVFCSSSGSWIETGAASFN